MRKSQFLTVTLATFALAMTPLTALADDQTAELESISTAEELLKDDKLPSDESDKASTTNSIIGGLPIGNNGMGVADFNDDTATAYGDDFDLVPVEESMIPESEDYEETLTLPVAANPASSSCLPDEDGFSMCMEEEVVPENTTLPGGTLGNPATPAAVQTLPSYCKRHTGVVVKRNALCRTVKFKLTQAQQVSGKRKVIGTNEFLVFLYQTSSKTSGAMSNQATIIRAGHTGAGSKTTIALASPQCSGACSRTGSRNNALVGKSLTNQVLNGESYFQWTGTKNRTNQSMSWYFSFSNPNVRYNYTESVTAGGKSFRCDREQANRTGCIVNGTKETLNYSLSAYPNFGKHVRNAQASGLPGANKPLTRLTASQDANKNRRQACPTRLKRPAGKSCDEYPFASTQQGAFYGGGSGRTFSGCSISDSKFPTGVKGAKGFSSCMITAKENSAAGNALKVFNDRNHVLRGDQFYIKIK